MAGNFLQRIFNFKIADQQRLPSVSMPAVEVSPETASRAILLNSYSYDQAAMEADKILDKLGRGREYLKAVEYDAEVSNCYTTRRDFVTSTPLNYVSDDENTQDFINAQLNQRSHEIMTALYSCVGYGYVVVAINYKNNDDGTIGINEIRAMPLEYFRVSQTGVWSGLIDGVYRELDKWRFTVLVRNQTFENMKGEALFSRVFWSVEFKRNGQNFWAQFLERFCSPIILGKSPADYAQDETGKQINRVQELANTLAASVRNRVISVNDDQDVTTLEASGNGESFHLFDSTLKDEIQKLILGSGAVTQTENNNRASGRTGESTLEQKINSDLRLMLLGVQDIANKLIDINNLYGKKLKGKITVAIESAEDIKADVAARDKVLTECGVKFTPDYFKRIYNLKDTDIDIATPEPIPPQLQQPAPTPSADTQLSISGTTPDQRVIDNLGDYLLALGSPLEQDEVLNALAGEGDIDEIMLALVEKTNDKWLVNFENVLENARLLGYVHMNEAADRMDALDGE
jgi:hypothetical protein